VGLLARFGRARLVGFLPTGGRAGTLHGRALMFCFGIAPGTSNCHHLYHRGCAALRL